MRSPLRQATPSAVVLLLAGLGTSLVAGCKAPRAVELDPLDDPYNWVRESVQGRPLRFFGYGAEDKPTILFVASMHGDEASGTPLLEYLMDVLEEDRTLTEHRRALVVPTANPDGLALGTRRNANDVDLNRNFPASTFVESPVHGTFAASEPETRFLLQVIERFAPVGILTFHEEGEIIDFDGPAAGWAYRLARACDALDVRRLGARPGSLGSYAGKDRGIPTFTIELPRETNELTPEESWEIYGALLLEALRPER